MTKSPGSFLSNHQRGGEYQFVGSRHIIGTPTLKEPDAPLYQCINLTWHALQIILFLYLFSYFASIFGESKFSTNITKYIRAVWTLFSDIIYSTELQTDTRQHIPAQ